eukprot:2613490-Rhodomonas_salina.1
MLSVDPDHDHTGTVTWKRLRHRSSESVLCRKTKHCPLIVPAGKQIPFMTRGSSEAEPEDRVSASQESCQFDVMIEAWG